MSHCQSKKSDVKHILAVDDSPDNLLLLETLLDDVKHYRLSSASNGPDALALIDSDPPDLVLLDVMMPEMDGYEVTRHIRSNKSLPFIPILLLTAHRQAEVAVGLDSGADDFIRKPFQVNELMARVRALLRLKHSIDQQNKIMRQRDDFVARLTHDLRTPIIATNRVLDFCRRGTYGPQLEDISPYLTGVIENNDQLLHMVNSLLEVYRHEAKRKKLTVVRVDLLDLINSVAERLRPLAVDKSLELAANFSKKFSDKELLKGDRVELSRVFTNIIGNSIKFTQSGSVRIDCDYWDSDQLTRFFDADSLDPARRYYRIQISDTGIEMSPDDLRNVFERFRPGTHVNSGSGLGLHLSKRIVELHKGAIGIDSTLGQGTTVQVLLPLAMTLNDP